MGATSFPELKAKMVRMPMPISPAVRTVRRKRFNATAMPLGARQATGRRPTAVAIHDDGECVGGFRNEVRPMKPLASTSKGSVRA